MLIAQLTDIHLGFVPDDPDELNRRRLDRAIAALLAHDPLPDLLLATGDLTDLGDPASYARLREAFAALPFPEHELRELVASHLCEMAASMENFSSEDKLMTLLAVSAKLVLENLVLNVQLLRRHGEPVHESVEGLLGRLRRGE